MRIVKTINEVMLLAINFSSDEDRENLDQYIAPKLPAVMYNNSEDHMFEIGEHGFDTAKAALEFFVGNYNDITDLLVTLVDTMDDADHPGGYFCIYNQNTKRAKAFYVSEEVDDAYIIFEPIDVQY